MLVRLAASNIPVLADHPLQALRLDDLARDRVRDEIGVDDVRPGVDPLAKLIQVSGFHGSFETGPRVPLNHSLS